MPHSLQGAIHALVSSTDYVQAVRMTIRAGGCNASRAGFIGACLAAQNGKDAIPASWIEKTKRSALMASLADQLVSLREETDDKSH